MTLRTILLGSILFALAGCNQEPVAPEKPQINADRGSLRFGLEYQSGDYIGTQPQDSVQITNGGQEDLTLSSVEIRGDGAFTKQGPDKTTLKQKEHAFITVFFKPTQAKDYAGQLIIHSNAENTPDLTIDLAGRGVAPPAP